MKHLLTTAPTETPVTIAEAKGHCRVDGSDEDAWFTAAVATATSMCEGMAHRAFCTQRWRLSLDRFPSECDGKISLPRPRLLSVISVVYFDTAGDEQTLDPADYQVDDQAEPGAVYPSPNVDWPDTEDGRVNAVQIVYECGYGAAAEVDGRAKQAILMLVAYWYENREAVLVGTISKDMEHALTTLMAQLWHGRMW